MGIETTGYPVKILEHFLTASRNPLLEGCSTYVFARQRITKIFFPSSCNLNGITEAVTFSTLNIHLPFLIATSQGKTQDTIDSSSFNASSWGKQPHSLSRAAWIGARGSVYWHCSEQANSLCRRLSIRQLFAEKASFLCLIFFRDGARLSPNKQLCHRAFHVCI